MANRGAPMPDDVKKMLDDAAAYGEMKQDTTRAAEITYDRDTYWKSLPTMLISARDSTQIVTQTQALLEELLRKENPARIQSLALYLASHLKSTTADEDVILNADLEANTHQSQRELTIPANEDQRPDLTGPAAEAYTEATSDLYKTHMHLWGPALGAIVLRLEKRDASHTLNKLKALRDNLSRLYPGSNSTSPPFTNGELWIESLKVLQNKALPEEAKNTVFLGYIFAGIRRGISSNTTGLLDFLMLQSLRYTGMHLITLTAQLCEKFHCKDRNLMEHTLQTATLKSWRTYTMILQTYLRKPETIQPQEEDAARKKKLAEDPLWMYAREFKSGVFADFAFPQNTYLCTLLAIMVDYFDKETYSPAAPGGTVKGLILIRKVNPSQTDYDLAFVIYEAMRNKYVAHPVGEIAEEMQAALRARQAANRDLTRRAADPNLAAQL